MILRLNENSKWPKYKVNKKVYKTPILMEILVLVELEIVLINNYPLFL